jgi:hypothetical protein
MLVNANANQTLTRIFGINYSHLIVGWAVYMSSTAWASGQAILIFQDAGTTQVDLRTDASGHVFFTRNGTNIGSTSTVTLTGGWNYIEVEVLFSATVGTIQCWLNGVSIIGPTGSLQTESTGNAFANRLIFEGANSGGTNYLKDIYVQDGTQAGAGHFGDISVSIIYPNSAGVNQQWTPLSSTQVSQIQDGITHTGTWPDGDTTYIFDNTAGDISDFGHQTLSLTGTIFSVIHASYVRKDDAGSRAFRQVCLSNGTTETNGSDISSTNTYLYYFDTLDVDPHTSSQWTLSNFNAATFGVKEIT